MNISFARCWLVLAILALSEASAHAQKVEADESGRMFFTDAAGKRSLIPVQGKCTDPSLAPGKRRVVFVRATPDQMVSGATGDEEATELCVADPDGKNFLVLVRGKFDQEPSKMLANFQAPQFSPDGKTIYFVSSAWVTSGSVQAYNLAAKKLRFVMAGSDLEVVPSGEYAGNLLVQQHRYFLGGGSYDWYWLMKPDGKEIGVVGESTEVFKDTYYEVGKR